MGRGIIAPAPCIRPIMAAMDGELKLLCDEMLAGLGRWLRAAGHDTLIAAPGTPDREIMAMAREQGRLLITRDRKMLERKGAAEIVFLLNSCGLESWVASLSRELSINWLYRPFSRCLLCNTLLEEGSGPCPDQLPDSVLAENRPLFHCPHCRKFYWEGGHVARMRRQLERWQM